MRAVVLIVGLGIGDAIQRMDLDDGQLAVTGAIVVALFLMDFVEWVKGVSK